MSRVSLADWQLPFYMICQCSRFEFYCHKLHVCIKCNYLSIFVLGLCVDHQPLFLLTLAEAESSFTSRLHFSSSHHCPLCPLPKHLPALAQQPSQSPRHGLQALEMHWLLSTSVGGTDASTYNPVLRRHRSRWERK